MRLFGFRPDQISADSPELLQSKRFLAHATIVMEMFDTAISLLGPDFELLAEIMTNLGKKHQRIGVTVDMYPVMGECLLYTLRKQLGDEYFTKVHEIEWKRVYAALTTQIIKGTPSCKKSGNKSVDDKLSEHSGTMSTAFSDCSESTGA